jgi:corrinoid protein of di/trimethylamine methyltransferase
MSAEQIFEDLKQSIIELDEEKAVKAANDLIAQGIDPLEGIDKGLSPGMLVIGDKFNREECYLPHLVIAGCAFDAALKILEPEILKRGVEETKTGVVVLGTVKGDIHKIGKDIFGVLLKTRGFEVHNLGEDVSMLDFVNKAEEVKADIIGMSSLLTTTMPTQKEVVNLLKEKGIRDKYTVLVGGGVVSQEWADEIEAEGYAETAEEGVRMAVDFISLKK